MASAYSPDAIRGCYDTIKAATPSAQLSGIYASKPGYHNARAQLPSSDYSVQQSYDKEGDAWAASAIDITLSDADMKRFTQRLIDATKAGEGNGGKLRAVRSFFGTTNGTSVTGMDVPGQYWITSDPSHLWHIHASSRRKHANDKAAWQDVASVILGTSGGASASEDEIMSSYKAYTRETDWNVPESSPTWTPIDDDNNATIVSGGAKFQVLFAGYYEGLKPGACVKVRYYVVDVYGDKQTITTYYPTSEIIGTAGETYGQHMQFGSLPAPASGHSIRLRMHSYADDAGVKMVKAWQRVFWLPS